MQMIINGQFVDAKDGKTLDVVNPAFGTVVDTVPAATLEDLDYAISLAVEGQKEWNKVPLYDRLDILETYCRIITKDENVQKIAEIMCEEGGKPIEQARTEVYANAAIFRIYCAAA